VELAASNKTPKTLVFVVIAEWKYWKSRLQSIANAGIQTNADAE
jgi:hypothetical protein